MSRTVPTRPLMRAYSNVSSVSTTPFFNQLLDILTNFFNAFPGTFSWMPRIAAYHATQPYR